jgi:hypothetical protein
MAILYFGLLKEELLWERFHIMEEDTRLKVNVVSVLIISLILLTKDFAIKEVNS